ncbi:hypothetical protein OEZ85_008486 [Tetradesmus obliquus]|uniref:Uncharacterized protein n=1 Tax=Tetradesmus obliquus TaxID=3088 RepID=A0ABY8TJB6_TETOB|nr:hypothetical protein OEZ85_008486 [Tetradesmus obliquus]
MTSELRELGAAVAALLVAMRQVLALGGSVEGSMSATTEQLEEQLVENTEEVEECMAALQEVCAVSRRASAAGPALLALFNPYARTSLMPHVTAADGMGCSDADAAAGTSCLSGAAADSVGDSPEAAAAVSV